MSTYILVGIICLLLVALVITAYYAIKFALIILNVTDALEESLDVLDERYASISKIMEIPLFYDSPEIRRVLDDVSLSRDAILYIANQLSKVEGYNSQDAIPEDTIEKGS